MQVNKTLQCGDNKKRFLVKFNIMEENKITYINNGD